MALLAEGFIRYPDELPCPQVDTDLTPRERRYISDIGEVKRLRRFQSTFQAERQKISFIFTRAQAEEFQKWYKEEIIEGGAWFYADWPILHKEKRIAYRFVTRPVWEFLARGVYHVTASVETYERKVGRAANVYTSKIYPYYFNDSIMMRGLTARGTPYASIDDSISTLGKTITQGAVEKYKYSSYNLSDEAIQTLGKSITAGTTGAFIYSSRDMSDEAVTFAGLSITSGSTEGAGYLNYSYFDDNITTNGLTITSGEIE